MSRLRAFECKRWPTLTDAMSWSEERVAQATRLIKWASDPKHYRNDYLDSWDETCDIHGRRDCQGWTSWMAAQLHQEHGWQLSAMRGALCGWQPYAKRYDVPEPYKSRETLHAFLAVRVIHQNRSGIIKSFMLMYDIRHGEANSIVVPLAEPAGDYRVLERSMAHKLGYDWVRPAVAYEPKEGTPQ